ncbi:MAG: NUDIX domain-containing protein [Desulfobulbaceae bacterium]|jgi:8-oxo-dGTP diphosphatase
MSEEGPTNYVVGFLFSPDGKRVALLRKNHPDWQKGKLNGIGGKIETGETPLQAMVREFREKAGANVTDWRPFCQMKWRGGLIHFFAADTETSIASHTDEEVGWYWLSDLHSLPTTPHLLWLIPMARIKERIRARVEDPT